MTDSLTEDIVIDASPERVFAAWTDARHLAGEPVRAAPGMHA
jgi:uncharacterized protein YndB with AHSA1/START domain